MNKEELDVKITEVAKSILSYCIARTSNQIEAEDLAQDIMLEICKSVPNLKNEEAFYGFMWAIAGNVYKEWCKREKKVKEKCCELDDNFSVEELEEEDRTDIHLLRRELTLLAEKYRKAVILYYIDAKSCIEIADILSVSESMVKYLLFKSRQRLKEGIGMERSYGECSYNPKGLQICFWGDGNGQNRYYHLCDSKISQNILFSCYNDKLSEEQISLEIGVSLPYMEDKIKELCEFNLLKREGKRYVTNMVIFTQEFAREVCTKTDGLKEHIANILAQFVSEHENDVRNIGFVGADMDSNTMKWQIVCGILHDAIIDMLQDKIELEYPTDKFGENCFVFGKETGIQSSWESQFTFGAASQTNDEGDEIRFMDFLIHGKKVYHYLGQKPVSNVFLDIAKEKTVHFSTNDKAIATELISCGYVTSGETGLSVNVPVLTEKQYQECKRIFHESAMEISNEAEKILNIVSLTLKNHCPVYLKKQIMQSAYLYLLEDAVSTPIMKLFERKYLLPCEKDNMLPTTYVVLKE